MVKINQKNLKTQLSRLDDPRTDLKKFCKILELNYSQTEKTDFSNYFKDILDNQPEIIKNFIEERNDWLLYQNLTYRKLFALTFILESCSMAEVPYIRWNIKNFHYPHFEELCLQWVSNEIEESYSKVLNESSKRILFEKFFQFFFQKSMYGILVNLRFFEDGSFLWTNSLPSLYGYRYYETEIEFKKLEFFSSWVSERIKNSTKLHIETILASSNQIVRSNEMNLVSTRELSELIATLTKHLTAFRKLKGRQRDFLKIILMVESIELKIDHLGFESQKEIVGGKLLELFESRK